MCEEPLSPGLREGVQGTLVFIMTLVALPQGGGVKRTMLPMPGPRAMAASVSCYRVVQVDAVPHSIRVGLWSVDTSHIVLAKVL